MDSEIASILLVDGLANGSMYLLAGIGLVMLFCVTRVIFLPFGDIVAFSALTMVAFEAGRLPPTIWLVMSLAVIAALVEAGHLLRRGRAVRVPLAVAGWIGLPAVPCLLGWWVAGTDAPAVVQMLLSIALVVPIAPLVARVALQPIANASVLALLMVALALHFLLTGLGLMFFGPEGARTTPLLSGDIQILGLHASLQTAVMIGTALLLCLVFYAWFDHTVTGKALRATAVNRVGARLVGIRPARSALVVYAVASLLAGVIGQLIAPVITMSYDSGFAIGLIAFVAATIGGLVSYPLTALGALAVGQVESFASFWTGTFKELIVFSMLIPVLILRTIWSGQQGSHDDEGDER